MKIKQAVNRIFWRFGGNGNKNPFPVNESDVEAYNSIKEYVKQKEKEQFQNNELFAKMFIFLYQKVLEKDKTNVLEAGMTAPRRKIYNLLKKPMYQIIKDFTQSLNDSELYEFMDDAGIKDSHNAILSKEERKDNLIKLKEALENPENRSKFFGEVWDFNFVAGCLESEVNQALELFSSN